MRCKVKNVVKILGSHVTGVAMDQWNRSLQTKGLDRGAVCKIARPSAMLDNDQTCLENVWKG